MAPKYTYTTRTAFCPHECQRRTLQRGREVRNASGRVEYTLWDCMVCKGAIDD